MGNLWEFNFGGQDRISSTGCRYSQHAHRNCSKYCSRFHWGIVNFGRWPHNNPTVNQYVRTINSITSCSEYCWTSWKYCWYHSLVYLSSAPFYRWHQHTSQSPWRTWFNVLLSIKYIKFTNRHFITQLEWRLCAFWILLRRRLCTDFKLLFDVDFQIHDLMYVGERIIVYQWCEWWAVNRNSD